MSRRITVLLILGVALGCFCSNAPAGTVPANFQETVAFSGFSLPTSVALAPDGRIFVAEKSGVIKVFNDLDDKTPDVLADLSTKVHNYWDRGLLGMAFSSDGRKLYLDFTRQPDGHTVVLDPAA